MNTKSLAGRTDDSGDQPGLLAYYRFDEPGGDTIFDSSPNGRDGTLGADASSGTDDPMRIDSGAPVPSRTAAR